GPCRHHHDAPLGRANRTEPAGRFAKRRSRGAWMTPCLISEQAARVHHAAWRRGRLVFGCGRADCEETAPSSARSYRVRQLRLKVCGFVIFFWIGGAISERSRDATSM